MASGLWKPCAVFIRAAWPRNRRILVKNYTKSARSTADPCLLWNKKYFNFMNLNVRIKKDVAGFSK
ncbi:MAG: hypothetical protein QM661_03885, partial [Solimonas sp.]